jgi:hydroxyacylglutathione hydrolase
MFQVHQIPAFKDNYFWLIQPDICSSDAFIIDSGAAEPVITYLQTHNLDLKAILLTHHHHDHIDGAQELSTKYRLPIYGPSSDRIPQVTHYLKDGDYLNLNSLTAKVIALPGHTLDHIAYFIETPGGPPMLFSGDTIFAAGCGRLFDGTAALLYASLQKIAALPTDTLIYAAHEYTLSNISFALHVEPDNEDLKARSKTEREKRDLGIATLPTQLELEKRTNPFLRCHLNSIRTRVHHLTGKTYDSNVDFFTSLRLMKDSF